MAEHSLCAFRVRCKLPAMPAKDYRIAAPTYSSGDEYCLPCVCLHALNAGCAAVRPAARANTVYALRTAVDRMVVGNELWEVLARAVFLPVTSHVRDPPSSANVWVPLLVVRF